MVGLFVGDMGTDDGKNVEMLMYTVSQKLEQSPVRLGPN